MKLYLRLALTMSLLSLLACEPPVQPSEQGTDCTEPRPQMCTREYQPVCGLRDTGIRCVTEPCPSIENKTYGNACDACADPDVISYSPGACESSQGE